MIACPDKMSGPYPLVSIIVPVRDRAGLIKETLLSVQQQSYPNWECIIVDDNSHDGTQGVVNDFVIQDGRFSFHIRPVHCLQGANSCRNYGLSLAQGEYVNWLDSDDILLPDCLKTKVGELTKNGGDFVVSKSMHFSTGTTPLPQFSYRDDEEAELNLANYATGRVGWLNLDAIYTRSSLQGIEWDPTLTNGHEFNFNCRYLARHRKGHFLDVTLASVRRHPNSIMGHALRVRGSSLYLKEKYRETFKTSIALRPEPQIASFLLARALHCHIQLSAKEREISSLTLAMHVFRTQGLIEAVLFLSSVVAKQITGRYFKVYNILRARMRRNFERGNSHP